MTAEIAEARRSYPARIAAKMIAAIERDMDAILTRALGRAPRKRRARKKRSAPAPVVIVQG